MKPAFLCFLTVTIQWLNLHAWSPRISRRQLFVQTAGLGTAAAGAASASAFGSPDIFTPSPGSLADQTIVITGATGPTGLGLESARRLAVGGATVILTARSTSKGEAAVRQVQDYLSEQSIENPKISYKILDLDDLSAVKQNIATSWKDVEKIDVLMNNAGVMAIPDLQLTKDGYERTIQSNHLGHFVLTSLLSSKFAPDARIINVSSTAHMFASGTGLLPADDLWKPDEKEYGPWKSYGQSKLANILFTEELQRRIDAAGKQWTAVSLHPGAVQTDLARNMMGEESYQAMKEGKASASQVALMKTLAVFIKDVPDGANTQVWLAARADDVNTTKGQYFDNRKVTPLKPFAKDGAAAERLWKESEERAGLEFKL